MIEGNLDAHELDRLISRLKKSPEILREAKRDAFQAAAPRLKQAVDQAIGGTGKVRGWQESHVGSKGGYAAVRPKANTYTAMNKRGKRYAVGAVTNAIDSGHKFPSPSGRNKRYKARIRVRGMKVEGRHFYQAAADRVPEIARKAAQQVEDRLIAWMEGGS